MQALINACNISQCSYTPLDQQQRGIINFFLPDKIIHHCTVPHSQVSTFFFSVIFDCEMHHDKQGLMSR
jgi:hypothetical protein